MHEHLLVALPKELGLPVKQPLLRYVESLPTTARDVLRPAMRLWYAAEVFLAGTGV